MRIGFWLTTPKRFDPERVWDTPFGGAEISALLLAQELGKYHIVEVFGNVTHMRAIGNLAYASYGDLKTFEHDVLIIVRADQNLINPRRNGLLFGKKKPRLILWTGDAADQPNNQVFHDTYCLRELSLVVAKSKWQKGNLFRHFPLLNKIAVMYNGVDSPAIEKRQEVKEPRFIYGSTAYRGMHRFLSIWPEIKERIPDAELDCYCKTTLYLEDNPRDAEWADLYDKVGALPGVTIKEPLPHKQFIRELGKYYAMLYPNSGFVESSCGVVLNSQACGTPVITTAKAGLPETVAMGNGFLVGDDKDPDYDKKFVEAAVKLWQDKEKREEVAEYGYRNVNEQYSWRKVAGRWQRAILNCRESWSGSHVVEALPIAGSRKASAVLS